MQKLQNPEGVVEAVVEAVITADQLEAGSFFNTVIRDSDIGTETS